MILRLVFLLWTFLGDSQSQQVNGSDKFNETNPNMLSCFLRIKGISLIINKCALTLGIKNESVNDSAKSKSDISPHYFHNYCQNQYEMFSLLETNIPNRQNTTIMSVTNFSQYVLVF